MSFPKGVWTTGIPSAWAILSECCSSRSSVRALWEFALLCTAGKLDIPSIYLKKHYQKWLWNSAFLCGLMCMQIFGNALVNFQKLKGQTKFKLDCSLPLSLSSCLLSFSLFSSLLFLPHLCLSLAFYFPHKHTYAFTDPHNPHHVLLSMHCVQSESESVSCLVKPESEISGTVACQVPLSMEFSRQKYWSG